MNNKQLIPIRFVNVNKTIFVAYQIHPSCASLQVNASACLFLNNSTILFPVVYQSMMNFIKRETCISSCLPNKDTTQLVHYGPICMYIAVKNAYNFDPVKSLDYLSQLCTYIFCSILLIIQSCNVYVISRLLQMHSQAH